MSGRILLLLAATALLSGAASGSWAQSNGLQPAELPPVGFSGRQYVDSAGCLFQRSTVGGVISWVPLFDATRRPVCNDPPGAVAAAPPATPAETAPAPVQDAAETQPLTILEATVTAPDTAPEAAQETATVPAVAPAAVPAAAVPARATPRPAAAASGNRPAARAAAPTRRTQRLPETAGHHPACPAHAPFGQPVRRPSGEVAIRCVEDRSLMLATSPHSAEVVDEASLSGGADAAADVPLSPGSHRPRNQAWVQVGSFAMPANAARTRAALEARGLQVSTRQVRQGGRTLTEVRVGPVFDQVMAQDALIAAHALGLRDAFVRR